MSSPHRFLPWVCYVRSQKEDVVKEARVGNISALSDTAIKHDKSKLERKGFISVYASTSQPLLEARAGTQDRNWRQELKQKQGKMLRSGLFPLCSSACFLYDRDDDTVYNAPTLPHWSSIQTIHSRLSSDRSDGGILSSKISCSQICPVSAKLTKTIQHRA